MRGMNAQRTGGSFHMDPELDEIVKTEMINAYLDAVAEVEKIHDEIATNEDLRIANDMVCMWTEKMDALYRPLADRRRAAMTYVDALVTNLCVACIPAGQKKATVGVLELSSRTTRSFVINTAKGVKDSIVKKLVAMDKVEDGVKSFSVAFLRKMADMGLLPLGTCAWDEKTSYYVNIVKDE